MRVALAALASGLCAVAPARVLADDAQAAQSAFAEAEQLAKQRQFSEAIAKFREADRLAPSAKYDCFVSLAYRRLERWSLAKLYSVRCGERATAADPEPAWMASVRTEIDAAISRAGLVEVRLVVQPAEVAAEAQLEVSHLGADSFPPGTIALPPGDHQVIARAPGHSATTEITVRGPDAEEVVIDLAAKSAEPVAEPASGQNTVEPPATPVEAAPIRDVAPAPHGDTGRGPWPIAAFSVAGAAAVGGAIFHIKAVGTKSDAERSGQEYDRLRDRFGRERAIALSLYAAGVVAAGVGAYLWLRSPGDRGAGITASATPIEGGAIVQLSWGSW